MNNDYLVQKFFHEYHDRGMMKWEGFYLSDHTSALNKTESKQKIRNNRQRSSQMDDNEIRDVVSYALQKDKQVIVELLEMDRNSVLPDSIKGKIEGYLGNKLIIANRFVDIGNIYSVEMVKATHF